MSWEPNSSALQEQSTLLATEPSPQPRIVLKHQVPLTRAYCAPGPAFVMVFLLRPFSGRNNFPGQDLAPQPSSFRDTGWGLG